MKVLVSDPLGPAGMKQLKDSTFVEVTEKAGMSPDILKKEIGQFDAIIIRSGTKLTSDILAEAKNLKVVGRAGVGVDNVHLETATQRGIIVMNTPEGNTISTAEHTFSMIMALARNIPQADASVKKGEWKRSKFLGSELNGKTLGVIGYGRIGREVSKRAAAFNMKVVVFDPFINKENVKNSEIDVLELKELLQVSDFITVHTPLTDETKHLINMKTIKHCKKGVRIINCARGGIFEEAALIEGLESGIVAGVALDVFESEPPAADHPLLQHPKVIATPHLGAATQEAQENVAVDVVKQVLDALQEKAIKNAVNLPSLDPETYAVLKPWILLAEKLGLIYLQLFPGQIESVDIRYGGEITKYKMAPMTNALVKGLLTPMCGETVNYVNAPAIAKERGIVVNESRTTQQEDFSSYIEIRVNEKKKNGAQTHIMGTLFGNQLPRIVQINEYRVEVDPRGVILFVHNEDQPGVVGNLGRILGKANINIAEMSLGRVQKGSNMLAMTIINTDNEVSEEVLEEIQGVDPIIDAKVVKL